LEPLVSGSDDSVGISSPDERLWCLVVFGNEAVDGGLAIDDRVEYAIWQSSPCQDGEEALDGVSSRRR
jgi:hypothetical protein